MKSKHFVRMRLTKKMKPIRKEEKRRRCVLETRSTSQESCPTAYIPGSVTAVIERSYAWIVMVSRSCAPAERNINSKSATPESSSSSPHTSHYTAPAPPEIG